MTAPVAAERRRMQGNKYHEKDCIFVKDKTNVHRMTEEEFESGEYEPCRICLP